MKHFIFLWICLAALLGCSACGSSPVEEELSERGYQIGTETVEIVEHYIDGDVDAETVSNKIVPLSLYAEQEDLGLTDHITDIVGDICNAEEDGIEPVENDAEVLRAYIGYLTDEQKQQIEENGNGLTDAEIAKKVCSLEKTLILLTNIYMDIHSYAENGTGASGAAIDVDEKVSSIKEAYDGAESYKEFIGGLNKDKFAKLITAYNDYMDAAKQLKSVFEKQAPEKNSGTENFEADYQTNYDSLQTIGQIYHEMIYGE